MAILFRELCTILHKHYATLLIAVATLLIAVKVEKERITGNCVVNGVVGADVSGWTDVIYTFRITDMEMKYVCVHLKCANVFARKFLLISHSVNFNISKDLCH